MNAPSQRWTVVRLGTSQTLAWASSYYLPAMLAEPMARDLGVATSAVFAAFSVALIVSALLGPMAGHAIDRQQTAEAHAQVFDFQDLAAHLRSSMCGRCMGSRP